MQRLLFATFCLCATFGLALINVHAASSAASVGQTAPEFTLQGADGKNHSLSDYKGKFVVLEWTNPECPFVHKFYDSGAMQKLQKEETGKGVAWLRINSGAPGLDGSGSQSVAELASYVKSENVSATQSLLDPNGKVGHAYGARTTPNMFVIDPKGTLIYAGGIDDKSSPDQGTLAGAHNYVAAALDEAMAGKPVATPTTRPYGCGVKYAK